MTGCPSSVLLGKPKVLVKVVGVSMDNVRGSVLLVPLTLSLKVLLKSNGVWSPELWVARSVIFSLLVSDPSGSYSMSSIRMVYSPVMDLGIFPVTITQLRRGSGSGSWQS